MINKIKSTIHITELITKFGLEPNRAGYISCPAHDDKTPSLKLYPDSNTWWCFSCNSGSSVIDIYMLITGTDFSTAVTELGAEYGLTPDSVKKPNPSRYWKKQRESKSDEMKQELNSLYREYWEITKFINNYDHNLTTVSYDIWNLVDYQSDLRNKINILEMEINND